MRPPLDDLAATIGRTSPAGRPAGMEPGCDPPLVMRRLFDYLAQRRELWEREWGASRADCPLVPLEQLPRRRLAEAIHSPVSVPAFRRAMMDGVAVSFTAWQVSAELAIVATVTDAVPMVKSATSEVASGAQRAPAAVVSTGGRVPAWADAVVPVEWLRTAQGETVTAADLVGWTAPLHVGANFNVRAGQHVAAVGEDVRGGQVLLDGSRPVRPQDLGLLAACGVTHARCRRSPRLALAMTGDEVVPPGKSLAADQMYDANGPVLLEWVDRDGGHVAAIDYLPDDPASVREYLQRDDVDVIVLCGGTSVGQRDYAARALAAIGQVVFQGLPLRPGRPAAVGHTGTATVFLLPGNPVACQFTYELLVGPLLRGLAGNSIGWPYRRQLVRLAEPVLSQVGRLDYLRVSRTRPGTSPAASTPTASMRPIASMGGPLPPIDSASGVAPPSEFRQENDWGSELALWDWQPTTSADIPSVWPLTSGRASNLTSVSRADGFMLVPWDRGELAANETIQVFWYDL